MRRPDANLIKQIQQIIAKLVAVDPVQPDHFETEPDLVLKTKDGAYLVLGAKSQSGTMVIRSAIDQVQRQAREVAAKHAGAEAVIPLIGVPKMGDTGQRLCDEAQVGWVDLAGNANIRGPGIVIHVAGRTAPAPKEPAGDNPFAQRSSRVVKRLLTEPERWFSQREMATSAGLNEGYVSKIVRRLERDRHLERDPTRRFRAKSPTALLDDWREHYDFGKHDRIVGHIGARSGDELMKMVGNGLERQGVEYAFTGLAGAWLLTQFASFRIGTVLVETLPNDDVLSAIEFRADPRGANLWIVAPGDSDPLSSATTISDLKCVDPIQVYLDLKGHPERAQEAAGELKQRFFYWSDNG